METQDNVKYLLGPVAVNFDNTKVAKWSELRPVVIDELCVGCGQCILSCPSGVITLNEETKKIEIYDKYCKSCGICSNVCIKKSIKMVNLNDESES
ncbi:4Fe-4S dicluster domain-containing protein [Cellulosilyticum ruminicola]|uniref:4Fe-4S dicluster domain-containing protein n=1 Tax=Cellulosilyticum ruminicola TaxID=425254 RepID=UPI0006CF5CF1|nr:4Fe-4S dicluster domain-containing protein [Cellulosilyticum ruminicola]